MERGGRETALNSRKGNLKVEMRGMILDVLRSNEFEWPEIGDFG